VPACGRSSIDSDSADMIVGVMHLVLVRRLGRNRPEPLNPNYSLVRNPQRMSGEETIDEADLIGQEQSEAQTQQP
jgi:hypothetical protein